MKPRSLLSSYVHLKDDRSADVVDVTPDFWPEPTGWNASHSRGRENSS